MTRPVADTVYRGAVEPLLRRIDERCGLDLTQYRRTYVERRLASRVRALGLHTYRQYVRYLESKPEEYERMLRALTINVTEFFRDPSVYAVFRDRVIPELVAAKSGARACSIRIWSAGCATGEEPYSIAMTMLDALGPEPPCPVRVIGTDLDPEALGTARAGWYDAARLERTPRGLRDRFMLADGEGYRVTAELAGAVEFHVANLFTDRPPRDIDAIFCRNVFIYLTKEQQARMLDVFARALAPGGILVLGRSEKLAAASAPKFETVAGSERIYRRSGLPLGGRQRPLVG